MRRGMRKVKEQHAMSPPPSAATVRRMPLAHADATALTVLSHDTFAAAQPTDLHRQFRRCADARGTSAARDAQRREAQMRAHDAAT